MEHNYSVLLEWLFEQFKHDSKREQFKLLTEKSGVWSLANEIFDAILQQYTQTPEAVVTSLKDTSSPQQKWAKKHVEKLRETAAYITNEIHSVGVDALEAELHSMRVFDFRGAMLSAVLNRDACSLPARLLGYVNLYHRVFASIGYLHDTMRYTGVQESRDIEKALKSMHLATMSIVSWRVAFEGKKAADPHIKKAKTAKAKESAAIEAMNEARGLVSIEQKENARQLAQSIFRANPKRFGLKNGQKPSIKLLSEKVASKTGINSETLRKSVLPKRDDPFWAL
jgi:hypothetical protein